MRDCVTCAACGQPRCIYCKNNNLSGPEQQIGHWHSAGVSSTHPVEPQYYSCRQKLTDVWALCGKAEVQFADPPDEVAQAPVVLIPLCMPCSASPAWPCHWQCCMVHVMVCAVMGVCRYRCMPQEKHSSSGRGQWKGPWKGKGCPAGRGRGTSKK